MSEAVSAVVCGVILVLLVALVMRYLQGASDESIKVACTVIAIVVPTIWLKR